MRRQAVLNVTMVISFAVVLGVAGCATYTDTTALDNARVAVAQAKANPLITTNAPVTLHEAEQSLQRAEDVDDEREQRHYAYLAQRQTEQATYEARQKASQQGITRAGQERQQVLLQRKEQEAAAAKMQAQSAEQRAQVAQQQAQTAQEQQEIAKGQVQAYQQQAQLARQQASQLQSQLTELQARQTNQGNVMLTLSDVMFATDQATIQPGAMMSLNKLADILKQNPSEKVFIEGHTDNSGTATYNQQLSRARANAVRQALIERGVSPDRIDARGLGEGFPVAGNDSQAGRQMNRRVDIIVTG